MRHPGARAALVGLAVLAAGTLPALGQGAYGGNETGRTTGTGVEAGGVRTTALVLIVVVVAVIVVLAMAMRPPPP
jgi:hypothetical protein